MMKKIRTAIVGMGKMGRLRAEAAARHGGFRVVAGCDINGRADYQDWRTCLEETRPEAVFICAINSVMADIASFALERDIHVFCEKPPGSRLADTLKMKRARENSGAVLKFGFNHRYHNSVLEAKALVDSNLLGKLVCARGIYGKAGGLSFRTEWRNQPALSGGGILIDQGIHMLDLFLYFMGDLSVAHSSVDCLAWEGLPAEDSAAVILRSPDSRVAMLHSSALQWKHKFDMDLMLTNGYIALNGLLTSTRSYGEERISYYQKDLSMETGLIGNPVEHTMCFDRDDSWDCEIAEFYDAAHDGSPVINGTIDDALRVMRLVEDIYAKGNLVSGE